MLHRIVRAPALAALLVMALASPACGQPSGDPGAGSDPGYDSAPLLESLRPAERRTVVREAGLGAADELPFYDMEVELADDLRRFELQQTVYFRNPTSRPMRELVFRLYANAVASGPPPVQVREVSCLEHAPCTATQPDASAVVVRLASPLPPGGRVRVQMRAAGTLREIAADRLGMMAQGMEGLGALGPGHAGGDYGLLAYGDGVASLGAFHPVLARMRGGRFVQSDQSTMGDLGSDALFHARAVVRTADTVRVVGTGVESAPRVVGPRIERTVTAAFIRDFALAASPRFEVQERRVRGGVTIRSFHLDGHRASGTIALDAGRSALALYTRRFGPYPFTELDLVEAPLVGGAGGVEFSGMVTLATMFYRPIATGGPSAGGLGNLLGAQSAQMEQRRDAMLEFVTAHEVAHQWWHGIVGSDSREHPFQDECLAQYSAILYVEDRHGAARARDEADQQVAAGYQMMRLMGRPDGAVDRPASAFADSMSYAGLVYGKGPYLYRELRDLLGDRRFFRALRGYVSDHRFEVAPPRALFDRMATGARAAEVRALERRWLDETHGDDDLGAPDLGQMLGGQLPGGQGVDPAVGELLRQLGGGGQGGADPTQLMNGLLDMLQGGQPPAP